jgi:uncharacterized protein HemY
MRAAPEACEILAALPARVGRSALRIERTVEGWRAGYGRAKAAEGKALPEALITLAAGAFDEA